MKRKITFLSAALMLFAFLAVPLGMWGQQVESGTTYSTPSVSGLPEGWSGEDGGGTNYIKLIDAAHYIQTANFEQVGFTSITIKARKYGGPSATQAQISVSWYDSENVETVLGTIDPTNTTLTNYTISNPATTENGTGYIKIQNKDASSNKGSGVSEVTITYVASGGTQPTTYTVTYKANVDGIDDVVDTYNEGTNVTLRDANTFANEGYTFEEWNTQAEGDGDGYAAGDVIENIQDNLELYAIWTENTTPVPGGDEQWVLTSLTDLTANDVFVIVGNNGSNYAMSNNNGTSSAPTAVAVTVANESITGTVADNIQWTVSGNANDGYTFYPNGSSEIWLYCTGTNNGVRVGTNNANTFKMENSGYLVHQGTSRYIGVYNSSDWRCYTTINSNIQGQSFAFYKKLTGGVLPPSISAENIDIAYDATSGVIEYTINNGVEGGTLSAATTSEWLTLGTVGETVPFTCTDNTTANNRTATVSLTYTYGDRQTVNKNVTVTQAGNPNVTPTIAEVREQGTGNVVTRGIVTSCVGTTGYIQDATAAICVYGSELTVGDEIRVSGTLSTYHGLLEITNPEFTVISQGNTIEPEVMSIAAINDGANQGWYIRIENATVADISNKSVTIAQGDNTIVVYFANTDDITFDANDVISLNGNIGCYNVAQIANPQNVEVQQSINPSITIDPATVSVDAEEHDGTLTLDYENLTITDMTDFDIQYYDANEVELTEAPDWIEILVAEQDPEIGEGYVVSYYMIENEGEARTTYFKVYAMDDETNLVYSNLVTINQAEYVAPVASITFDPDSLIFDSELHYDGTMPFTYENIIVESMQSFGLQFYTAEGEETGMPEWFFAMVTPRSDENNGEYQVSCAIMANEGEERSVYFKVYAFDADSIPVYSNLATVTQTAHVYDYAILPFVWEGGSSADFLALNGVTANGLGNDYASGNAPYLIKFDGTGDYIQVKTDSQPGMVTINVKMIGGSNTSTITIQGSADGVTFTDIETLTISGSQNDELTLETTNAFGANDRYVRMLFTKGSNVGVGPITITKGTVPSITLTPDIFELEAVGPLNGMHLPSMMVYCHNLEIAQASDFNYQFYNAEGEEQEMPEWILHSEVSLITETGYQAICIVTANEGPARSAYFKVYAYDADSNPVYSNLVTINQAAYEAPAETWVLTDLADLTEGDVFAIVGTRYDDNYAGNYAMPNDNGTSSAPAAVAIDVVNGTLSEAPAANLQWNLSRQGNSYTFYPNGDAENWLYCTNTNNGVRVGGTNVNNAFVLDESGYLMHVFTSRYIGIYNSQDWRCYTNTTGNIAGQTFAFYKKIVPTETYTLNVNGYGESETNGYVLLASPVYVKTETTGMTTGEFDLYYFDQSEVGYEWRNFEVEEGQFNLIPGKGYLYAHDTDVELTFMGIPYSGDGIIQLSFDADHTWGDENYYWNLVGNPFGDTAYIDRPFYAMNETGTEIMSTASQGAVAAMQGVFVLATEDGETLTFTTEEAPEAAANVTLNLSQNRGAVIDRTIVRFGEGRQLPKFQLNTESTKLYIPQGNNDYAVVRSAAYGEMPVNFKAQNNGSYTISVNAENAEANYLHLIDNMTGNDIDLLATPSYSFEAKTTDYASRFRLVFNITGVEENTNSTEPFAFFNGSEWVISNIGKATLQIVDLTGRILSSESISGNATVSTANLSTGIYLMRLVNGENVKTQKIVVK